MIIGWLNQTDGATLHAQPDHRRRGDLRIKVWPGISELQGVAAIVFLSFALQELLHVRQILTEVLRNFVI